MWKLGLIVLLAILNTKDANAACGQCTNGVACISNNEFQLCRNGIKDPSQTFKCPGENDICTRFAQTCIPGGSPACKTEEGCGSCTNLEDGAYICTSRTTFEVCQDFISSKSKMSCPENQLCDAVLGRAKKNPCLSQCKTINELCDRVLEEDPEPIDTTTEFAPTPPVTQPITNPVTDPVTEPVTEPITEPVTEPITNPVTDPVTEPITNPVTDPVTEPITNPVTEPITNPVTDPVTEPTATQNPEEAVCEGQTLAGRYPYLDKTICSSYVYCFWKSGTLHATPMKCPEEKYFNGDSQICIEGRPSGCVF